EYKRLGEAVDWLWNAKPHSALADAMLQTTSAEAQAVVKFAILLSKTWPARMIIRSQFLKTSVKKLLKKMANRSVA
ncbi:MAG: hypothetical protein WAT12_00935, partial [Candidatus Nitrotoga sp.]